MTETNKQAIENAAAEVSKATHKGTLELADRQPPPSYRDALW